MTDVSDAIVELANATAGLVMKPNDALMHRRAMNALDGLARFFHTEPADERSPVQGGDGA